MQFALLRYYSSKGGKVLEKVEIFFDEIILRPLVALQCKKFALRAIRRTFHRIYRPVQNRRISQWFLTGLGLSRHWTLTMGKN